MALHPKYQAGLLIAAHIVVAAGILAGFAFRDGSPEPGSGSARETSAARIVSMAPNITETLFALGLGDRVAGVTRFCAWPPEAREKPSVGGFIDPNYERIVALRPDLVLLLPEHATVIDHLGELGIRCEVVRNRTVDDILWTIGRIGELCGREAQADSLAGDLRRRIVAVRAGAGAGKPKVLISVSRDFGAGTVSRVYAAGPGTFYDELIGYAGGVNAYVGPPVAYPVLSAEGLISLDPDIIIDLVPSGQADGLGPEAWSGYGSVAAVRNGRVHVIDAEYAVIPGPRFILFLEELAGIVRSRVLP